MCPSAVSDSTMFHFIVTHNHILDIHFVYYSYLLISGLWIYFFSIAVFNHFSVLLFRFVILQVLLFWIIYEVVTDCKCKAWISSFAKKKEEYEVFIKTLSQFKVCMIHIPSGVDQWWCIYYFKTIFYLYYPGTSLTTFVYYC